MNDTYHHGDLPTALRAAAAELVAERGPTGFSLREVARRAGVSHGAPAHHFGTSKGLLTAVATEGFQTLHDALEKSVQGIDNTRDRFTSMGKAYLQTALDYPGHFGVMCNDELINDQDADFAEAAAGAYLALLDMITEVRDTMNPDLDVDTAATMTWSMVHGLAVLKADLEGVAAKTGTTTSPLDELMEKFTDLMIDGFAAR